MPRLAQGVTQWVRKIDFFDVGYSVTAHSAMYDQHEAIMTNHVPRQGTLMFPYSALNSSYLVLQVCASASILYIVQFPIMSCELLCIIQVKGFKSFILALLDIKAFGS